MASLPAASALASAVPPSVPPGFPCFPSGSLTQPRCPFPFVLPCFAPAAVPQVIPFRISSPGPVPDFRFLSSASVLASHYSASVSSFPPSPLPPHSGFRSSRLRSRFPGFPFLSGPISRAFLPGSRTRLSVRFLSSFLASLPQLFHECFPFGLSPSDPLSFVRFSSGSGYSASVSSFPFLPRFASQLLIGCCPSAFRLPDFSTSVPPGFPCFPSVSCTRLSVRFLSSFPASLPQLFHRCFPSFPLPRVRFSSGLFRSDPLPFVRRPSLLTTQPSALSFPFFPFSPDGGSSGVFRSACASQLSPSVTPVSMRSFRFRYSAFLQFLSPYAVSPHSGYPSASALFLSDIACSPWLSL